MTLALLAGAALGYHHRQVSPYASYIFETFITLLAVCALAFVVLYGARRLGIGRPSGPIQLYGQLPLDARRAIYLVRVGAQVFVVGVGEGGFTKLGEIAAADLPELPAEASTIFARLLRRPRAPIESRESKATPTARTEDRE